MPFLGTIAANGLQQDNPLHLFGGQEAEGIHYLPSHNLSIPFRFQDLHEPQ